MIQQLKSQISIDLANYDYVIVADGSSYYTDYMGGYGAIVLTPGMADKEAAIFAFGSATHTEVGRAELQAILHALHALFVENHQESSYQLELLKESNERVLVISDREDVVKSINKVYKRNVNRDMWAAFEWYEQYYDIIAEHTPRDDKDVHKIADAIASELRINLLDYAQAQQDNGTILMKQLSPRPS